MTAEHREQLEQALTELTVWRGPVPQLWRHALGAAKIKRPHIASRLHWLLHQRLSAGIAASIVVVALGATIAINLPHLGFKVDRSRAPRRRAPTAHSLRGVETVGKRAVEERTIARVPELLNELESLGYIGHAENADVAEPYAATEGASGRPIAIEGLQAGAASVAGEHTFVPDTGQPRQIVRKATVELLTDDVRAVFLKAAMVLSEADGEYVQESSITGSGETAQANLVLRVAADRLSEVLNALRELGEVRSEQVTGQDVTAQVVDLEARLRNEQRVEAELLELLERRNDAPLREILELRSTLSNVRGEIERLIAQRQQFGRLVSLATVLVIVRTDQTQQRPADFSIAKYFSDGVARAWQRGLIFLADTLGGLLSIIVGGLIWWILLVLVFAAVWRHRRRVDPEARASAK